jgi:hypothetical protein
MGRQLYKPPPPLSAKKIPEAKDYSRGKILSGFSYR